MKLLAHKILENNVNSHWWNVAKEKILLDVINSLSLPFEINALEPGVGAGYLLDKLNFKEKFGIDLYACQERSPGFRFIKADAEHLPFKNNAVELLLLIDMLEHVANDEKLIEDCFKILKRNGFMIIFVPALKALWSD
ncbi:MAG: class I SAM-dependent methyltransferase, partial [Candidatus Omnitrophica bacterium]|nr:class I SAM-dependent methyltransferase [Candidatus Omnitrophota bacterium]